MLGEICQFLEVEGVILVSLSVTVSPIHGTNSFAANKGIGAAPKLKAKLENNPRPCVAAITILSELRTCNISTLTLAIPLLEAVQVGVVALKLVVLHTPNSVAKITSFRLIGLKRAQRIGISGRLPSLLTQVVPPLLVYQTDMIP